MKNLVVHQHYSQEIKFLQDALQADKQIPEIQCTVDPNNDNLYILLNNELYTVSCGFQKCDITKINIAGQEYTKIVGLEYCIRMQELYCAYETGDIIAINFSGPTEYEHNTVCNFDTDIQCIKFSPDHEILVVVTNAGNVIIMLSNGQIINEADLYSLDFGSKQFVSVGWGKKETQFHGSVGKAAATAKQKRLDANESDSGRSWITWRDDGQFFAISFLHPETKIRWFKTFDREGNLFYTSERTNELGDCLAWKPSENLLATTIKSNSRHYIALYEQNGLKFKDFILSHDANEIMVTDLSWSPESDILAMTCKHFGLNVTMLQLWTERNGHLYLKQTIRFAADNPLLYATWTKEIGNENRLTFVTLKEVTVCSFNWCVNHSRGKSVEDSAVVGVIDGNKLHITAFRKGIVPPPLSHQTLQLEAPINAVIFAPDINNETSNVNSNMFCTFSCDNSFTIFRQKRNSPKIEYEIYKKYLFLEYICRDSAGFDIKLDTFSYVLSHFLWFTEHIILCSVVTPHFHSGVLGLLRLHEINSKENSLVEMQKFFALGTSIQHIVASPDANEAYIVSNGSVYKYRENSIELTNVSLDETCYQVDVVRSDSKSKKHVALTHTNRLLLDGREFAKCILSYFVHTDFLLFTTLRQTLVCIPYVSNPIEQMKQEDFNIQPWVEDIEDKKSTKPTGDVRRVERNAEIITTISQGSKVILQMPRGNLECVEPRLLVVCIVKHYLNDCNYVEAFDIMKKQRINFNLIYDHDPELFTENAEKFVDDIANPAFLSLFLSTLQDEDVTETLYSNCYTGRSDPSKCKILESKKIKEDKVTHVCKLLSNIMEKRHDADKLLQPILITLLKNPYKEGLTTALAKVKELITLEDSQKAKCSSHMSAEKALKFLLNAMDIAVLYDTALGKYDLELTMFIASKSQKDPKEYIPFLNSLKVMDKNYMKYTIDMRLKRYESALVHIAEDSTKFDICLNLICNRKLYKQALKLFKRHTTEHKRIAALYGEHLMEEKMYHEAGRMFRRSGIETDLDRAVDAFLLAGSWEDAVLVLHEKGLRPEDLCTYHRTAVKHLQLKGNYDEAATILLRYLNNAEEAVVILCEGRKWIRAMTEAYLSNVQHLIETHIIPKITEYVDFSMSQLYKAKEDFLRHKSRLALLRSQMNARQEVISNETFPHIEFTDILSETSIADTASQTSMRSKRSYRSSKNRRKQERKLLSLKEGSMFEDLSLVNALYHIITNIYKNIDEWTKLLHALLHCILRDRMEFYEMAERLQDEINNFFRLVEDSKSEIWDSSAPSSLEKLKGDLNYTLPQIQEMTAPLTSLQEFTTSPPDIGKPYLDII